MLTLVTRYPVAVWSISASLLIIVAIGLTVRARPRATPRETPPPIRKICRRCSESFVVERTHHMPDLCYACRGEVERTCVDCGMTFYIPLELVDPRAYVDGHYHCKACRARSIDEKLVALRERVQTGAYADDGYATPSQQTPHEVSDDEH